MLHKSVAAAPKKAFDYIVIGAGAAGCVTASRLAEAGAEVALIEAGPHATGWWFDAPAGALGVVPGDVSFLKKYNWGMTADANPHLNNRTSYFPRGRCTGGCTSINAGIYSRGNALDFEDWGAKHPGWNFVNILPVYKHLENNTMGKSFCHGTEGKQRVTHPHAALANSDLNLAFAQACFASGLVYNPDFNGEDGNDGYGVFQHTIVKGKRQSSFNAFIDPLLKKKLPNLHVITGCHAEQLLFQDEKQRMKATGVRTLEVNEEGTRVKDTVSLTAEKAVVCSLGALHTPALLQRSGIGSETLLKSVGDIDLKLHNPAVGENMIDHLNVNLVWKFKAHHLKSKSLSLHNVGYLYRQFKEYQEDRTGVLSNVTEMGAFARSNNDVDRPDLQLHFQMFPVVDHARQKTFYNGYTVQAAMLYPKSRGRVSIKAADALTNPLIETNFLEHEDDLRVMEQAVTWAEMLGSPFSGLTVPDIEGGKQINPYAQFGAQLVGGVPAAERHDANSELGSKENRIEYVRKNADSFYHAHGTCAMGGVVDERLEVKGVPNLYIADASVIPTPLGGNTAAACQMIGARCVDFLQGLSPSAFEEDLAREAAFQRAQSQE